MKKILFLAITALLFASCGDKTYKTIGKIEMDKLVTKEELYASPEKYLNKKITIRLDTLKDYGRTGGKFFHGYYEKFLGFNYVVGSVHTYNYNDSTGIIYTSTELRKLFRSQNVDPDDSSQTADYILYYFRIPLEPKPQESNTGYDKLLLQAHDTLDLILQDSLNDHNIDVGKAVYGASYSTERWITGVLSNYEITTVCDDRVDASIKCKYQMADFYLLPTGLRYNQIEKLPDIQW